MDPTPPTFLSRHLQGLSVTEGAAPPPRREHLVFEAAEDDAELHLRKQRASGAVPSYRRVTAARRGRTEICVALTDRKLWTDRRPLSRQDLTCLLTENPMETATKGNLSKRQRWSSVEDLLASSGEDAHYKRPTSLTSLERQ